MLADALLVGHHSETRYFWDRPPVVTSVLIQGHDTRGLVLLFVYLFSILWTCVDFLKYYGVLCRPKLSQGQQVQ
jgi:hypothetical protein